MPSLNTPRANHSSLAMNRQLYVICGTNDSEDGGYFNLIEVLGVRISAEGYVNWVSRDGWSTVDPQQLTPRIYPLVSPVKQGLLVYGGMIEGKV